MILGVFFFGGLSLIFVCRDIQFLPPLFIAFSVIIILLWPRDPRALTRQRIDDEDNAAVAEESLKKGMRGKRGGRKKRRGESVHEDDFLRELKDAISSRNALSWDKLVQKEDLNNLGEDDLRMLFNLGVGKGFMQVVTLLSNMLDINASDEMGETACHKAAKAGQVPALNFILDRGVDVKSLNKNGYSPLALAVEKGHAETVRALLRRNAHDPLWTSPKGESVIEVAATRGHFKTVTVLQLAHVEYEPRKEI